MRSIDATILAELEAKQLRPFMTLDITIDETHYRYTDCDMPIVAGGNTYNPKAFRPEPVKYGANAIVDQATLEIDNLDEVMTSLFVGSTVQGEPVVLGLVVLNASYNVISGIVTLFDGVIDQWTVDEEKVRITVTSEFAQWSQRTLAKHSASCRWKKFKGTECGYSGSETWCDQTYARCQILGNTDNFGGFRWLPSIIDKELWWGRERGEK